MKQDRIFGTQTNLVGIFGTQTQLVGIFGTQNPSGRHGRHGRQPCDPPQLKWPLGQKMATRDHFEAYK